MPRSSLWFLPSGLPTKTLYAPLTTPMRHMPRPSHPPCFHHPDNTGRRVQTMQLPIMQFSPTSCHFIHLRSKYSPKHPVFKHPQSMVFP
jgi:hypothetical protein